MILFRESMREPILTGRKTVTRRRGRKRWREGAVHLCYTRMPWGKEPGRPFARVRIVTVTREGRLGECCPGGADVEARREGFRTWADFFDYWCEIHGQPGLGPEPDWRVEFALISALAPEIEAQVREAMGR